MHIALKMAKIIESLDAFDIVMETTIAMNVCVCVCLVYSSVSRSVLFLSFYAHGQISRSRCLYDL